MSEPLKLTLSYMCITFCIVVPPNCIIKKKGAKDTKSREDSIEGCFYHVIFTLSNNHYILSLQSS